MLAIKATWGLHVPPSPPHYPKSKKGKPVPPDCCREHLHSRDGVGHTEANVSAYRQLVLVLPLRPSSYCLDDAYATSKAPLQQSSDPSSQWCRASPSPASLPSHSSKVTVFQLSCIVPYGPFSPVRARESGLR